MAAVDESALLGVLEQGLDQPAYRRALLLLGFAYPDVESARLLAMPIGQRDRHLLLLREQLFGSQMECTLDCPGCGETLEFSCAVSDLCVDPLPEPGELLELAHGEVAVRYRLPNSTDLESALAAGDDADGQTLMLERCIHQVTRGDRDVTGKPLPVAVQTAIFEDMERADPQGNMELDMTCPDCERRWQSPFDIVAYLWAELETWGQRLLGDIHVLAASYGWTEAEVLAVNPWRRRHYLERINQ